MIAMKNISKNLYRTSAVILFIVTVTLISCEKEEFNFKGDTTARIYFSAYYQGINTFKFGVLHTPIGSFGKIEALFPVRSTLKAPSNINVTCTIDNSLIEEFNSKNGTDYIPVPPGLAVLSASALTITEGAYLSADSLRVTVAEGFAPQLTGNGYVIPVRISSLSTTGDAAISTNLNTIYLVATTDWSNCYDNQADTDMSGTLAPDRSLWVADIDVTLYSGSLTQLFDGNTNSYWQIRPSQVFNLVVDLADVYPEITGIRTNCRQTSYGLTRVRIYSSPDSISWSFQGSPELLTSSSYQYVKFYAPISARYLRLESVSPRSSSRIYMGEFDIYRSDE